MEASPLLSTTATAAAALVAIVGGLLVSRVISLATERSGLEQRLLDLEAQLRAAVERQDDFADRLLHWDVQDVLWEGREVFATGRTDIDIRALIGEAGVDRDVDEVRTFVEQEIARYQAVREHLLPLFADGHPDTTLEEMCEAGVIDVAREDELAYDLVWEALEAEHPRPAPDRFGVGLSGLTAGGIDPNWRTVSAIRTSAEQIEHATLRRDEQEARHQVAALKIQVEQNELAIARVARPRGVVGGLCVLGYVTTTGTLVPLALMAAGVESLDWRGASAVVALFASGIALLTTYVSVEVHRMSRAR